MIFGLLLLALACGRSAEHESPGIEPQRVVVLAPAVAEMLDALGLADRVVGIGEFGPWPADLAGRPVVGGFAAPNVERILELDTDIVLTTRSEAGLEAHGRLEDLGVRVSDLDTSTYDSVFTALAAVGDLFDRREAAAEIARAMREELDALASRAAGLPRRSVLFVVGRDPLYVAGPGSHIQHMIELVGGENVAADSIASYQQLSMEAVLERLPEVIIDTSDNAADAARGRIPGTWGRWEFLPAVRDDRVYQVEPGRLVIPGLRLAEMTRLMARLVHPETFGEPTFQEPGAPRVATREATQ